MEEITYFRTSPQTECRTPSLRLFPIRRIASCFVMSFTILVSCTIGLARYTVSPSSPFASFADIFPGQAADTIEARGFFCIMIPYNALGNSEDERCILKLETGSISEIRVTIAQQMIHQTQFTLREDLLKLGDLMVFLGTPDARQNGHTATFVWRGSGIYASADSGSLRFSRLIPVSMVSFTDARLPGLESSGTYLWNPQVMPSATTIPMVALNPFHG